MILRPYQSACIDALNGFFQTNPPRYDDKGAPVPRNPLAAMPTGTGKSLTIAGFCAQALRAHPRTRIIMATHVKELIEQNAKAMRAYWPQAPIGIYSAGLKKKDLHAQLIFGGIASMKNVVEELGFIDILVIDEAHLLNPNADTMYQAFINSLKRVNPWLVVIGFTATPYRMGIGSLTNNGIFTDTAFDITDLASFNRLVYEGFLAPLSIKKPMVEVDLRNVGISNGDYKLNELQDAVDQAGVIDAIVRDFLGAARHYQRHSALLFASGVDHAEHVSECFYRYGVEVPAVHSKMTAERRAELLDGFKRGRYFGLVNNNILTTGFDHPPVDIIGMIRPTMSTGLWVQMLGRGTRPSPETYKRDCMVLDYAGNTQKLGPINDPVIPQKKKKGVGDAPIWVCPNCREQNHARALVCQSCGFVHDMTTDLSANAGSLEVMRSEIAEIVMFEVDHVLYFRHRKEGKPDSLRVNYMCGMRQFSEWVCLEHPEPTAKHARDWCRRRYAGEPPETTDAALALAERYFVKPQRISVWVNRDFPQVLDVEF